ncbi:MAG TPA: ATP-binding protein [Acidimicrobiia bacterium]|nr:ATP-binding protein [Acidimicrobiia bacterium]
MVGTVRDRSDIRDSRVAAERVVSWVRMAIVTSMGVIAAVSGRRIVAYPRIAWPVLAGAVAYAWLALWKTTKDAREGKTNVSTAWALSAVSGVFVIAYAAATGGAWSPITPVAITVVISTAIRFDLARSLAVAVGMAAGLAAEILWVPRPVVPWAERVREAAWWGWLMLAVALLVGVLSQAADLARQARAKAEAEAAAEHGRLEQEHRLRLQVESADQTRRDFLAALAHDFRTPVASIEALSSALARRSADLDPDERAEVAQLIEGHARHLAAMVAEVRDLAVSESLSAGGRVDLSDVYMPDLIRASAAAAGLPQDRLVTSIQPGVTVLRTDGEKTLRILANLLQNAAKHSPADEPVEVHLAQSNGLVEVAVLDRGPGIPPEIASQAFEKAVGFGPHRSSGLGMWIVAQFVESLQGSVWVEPRPGGGMAVRARFPLGVALSLPTALGTHGGLPASTV